MSHKRLLLHIFYLPLLPPFATYYEFVFLVENLRLFHCYEICSGLFRAEPGSAHAFTYIRVVAALSVMNNCSDSNDDNSDAKTGFATRYLLSQEALTS